MSPPRILVVDDEPDVEALISQKFRRAIRKGELEFLFARDGQDALDKLNGAKVDVIFSDINMPRMDGLTLLQKLNELDADLETVMVSAYGDMVNIRTAMNRGAFDFITKPIEFDDLELTLQKTLAHVRMLRQLRADKETAEKATAVLSRYFSPSVVETLSRDPDCMDPASERRTATFMFTDLANFTPLIEQSAPDVIVRVLNDYLVGLTDVIFAHGGTVMKIVGDAVQSVFGAPIEDADHAERAIACALEIDEFSAGLRARLGEEGVELGATRIGVNTGEAVIGNFGGEKFFEYTAYGDAVNVAARLEQANKIVGTHICVAESVTSLVDDFIGRPVGTLLLKGKNESIEVFEPLPASRASDPDVTGYLAAFDKLKAGDQGAKQAFAALVGMNAEDNLATFHLGRLLSGETGVEIVLPGA